MRDPSLQIVIAAADCPWSIWYAKALAAHAEFRDGNIGESEYRAALARLGFLRREIDAEVEMHKPAGRGRWA